MESILAQTAQFFRQYKSEISFGLTAVTLVMAGPIINSNVKRLTGALHWSLRYLIYVLLCTVGYSLLSQAMYRGVKSWVFGLPSMWLVIAVVGAYLLLAFLAKQQKEI